MPIVIEGFQYFKEIKKISINELNEIERHAIMFDVLTVQRTLCTALNWTRLNLIFENFIEQSELDILNFLALRKETCFS